MDFGSVTQTPFASFDPDSSSWRTWEHCLFEDSTWFSGRWPKSGTTLGGHAYELPTSALPTNAIACSSLRSLGTPTARSAKGKNAARIARGEIDGLLELQVATLPTPQARDGDTRGAQGKRYLNPERSYDLDDCVDALTKGMLLPTPVVNDMGVNKTVEWWDDWVEEQKAQHGNGNGHGKSLAIEVYRKATLLPTPTTSYSHTSAEEWRARRPAGNGQSRKMVGDLRIVIEEELNGDPTDPPSLDGKPSSDDQPPDP